ncbi:MAG: hypothetical protein M1827_004380 [Pycnora praestabilis]|nr:MAG: hypothetical protein M1827_004380 [Pycnora praestabilis]
MAAATEKLENASLSTGRDSSTTEASVFTDPSSTASSEVNPTANNNAGDLDVTNNIPTQADLDKVANLPVLDVNGASRPFQSLYSGDKEAKRILILFVRHFFCGNCQEYLRTLCSSITPESLLSLSTLTEIVVIGCGQPDLIPMYTETANCPFPIYADPTRKLYDQLGMSRTLNLGPKKPDYIQASFATNTLRSIYQGVMSGTGAFQGGNYKQVGGEFLFDRGKITWCHRMRNTRDHAEISELRRVLGMDEERPNVKKRDTSLGVGLARRSSSWGRRGSKGKDETRDNSPSSQTIGALAEESGQSSKALTP